MALKPGQRIPLALADGGDADRRRVFELHGALAALARLESIDWVNDQTEVSGAVTALVGELKLLAQLGGLIDREAELQRLDKRTASLVAEMQRIDGKLANDNFVAKAPAEVVERERSKREEMQHSLTELRTQRERIAAL
jgi:valyl-tRNA synthetase